MYLWVAKSSEIFVICLVVSCTGMHIDTQVGVSKPGVYSGIGTKSMLVEV